NRALINESRYLADLSEKARERGDAAKAVLLALEGVSDPDTMTQRPLVPEAATQLRKASIVNRELQVLPWQGKAVSIFPRFGTRFLVVISMQNWPLSSEHHWLVVETLTGRPVCTIHANERAATPFLGVDGSFVAYTSGDRELVVVSTHDCTMVRRVELPEHL